jgi:hypothetical protein
LALAPSRQSDDFGQRAMIERFARRWRRHWK